MFTSEKKQEEEEERIMTGRSVFVVAVCLLYREIMKSAGFVSAA